MPKSEKREPKIDKEKQEQKEPALDKREEIKGEEVEHQDGEPEAHEPAEQREMQDQERQDEEARRADESSRRDDDRRQDEERRRKEEDERLQEERDQEDRLRQEERDREDRELEEKRLREDEELAERRRREDEQREQRIKSAQEELDRIIRLQQEYERLRNQQLEQGKEAPGSYGRSILDDKIEAAERSMDETLAAVKRPDVEHAAPSNLDRAEGSNLDRAQGSLDIDRDIEESWSLEERTGIEKEPVKVEEKIASEDRDFEGLERELADLDLDSTERIEPERAGFEDSRMTEPSSESEAVSETPSSSDSDFAASWFDYGSEKEETAQQTVAEPHTDLSQWEKTAFDEDVIERTRDLDPVAHERDHQLEQEQMVQQFTQQQMFEHENTMFAEFGHDLFKAGRDREEGEREEQEPCHEGR